jgi:diacylglycerol diphosphate phosphatase/phosphatidate phosphatase
MNISTTNTDIPGIGRSFFCAILKHFVGGFRPYYIEACKPNWTTIVRDLDDGIYQFNATACTGNRRDVDRAYVRVSLRPLLRRVYPNAENSLQAFPSGHAASSFAAAIFLSLYLNAKLKVFSDHASDFWAFIVVVAPLILASLVSASMYTSHVSSRNIGTSMANARSDDEQQHQAEDMIFGMIIGFVLGTLAYRSAYASAFDFRYNHIPLPLFATRTQFSHYTHGRRYVHVRLEQERVIKDDKLVVWSWWKQSGATNEEKEKAKVWLRSIRSARVTGKELGSKAKPIMPAYSHHHSQEAVVSSDLGD